MTVPQPEYLLRHQPFLLYWTARTFSAIAFQMVGVAVGWQMYALTGSALDLGLIGLAHFVPATALVLVAGQLADRYDRRLILQLCRAFEALATAALAYASLTESVTKEFILSIVFVLGAARAFEGPTNQTLLPTLVSVTLFPRAVAASSSAQQVATIAGPMVGGLLYALSPTFTYTICCVLFALGTLLLVFLRYERVVPARQPMSLRTFFAGLSYIRQNRIVFGLIVLDLFAVLLGGATALLPVYAKDVLDVGPSGLGMLRAAPAVGGLAVLIALTRWPLRRRVGRTMFVMVAIYGVATIVFGVSTWFWLSWASLAILGLADSVSVVIRITLLQLETPDEMRGRVSSVNSLFTSTSNTLGDFRAGVTASLLGAIPAVLMGGIGTLIVVLICRRAFPEVYRADTFQSSRRT